MRIRGATVWKTVMVALIFAGISTFLWGVCLWCVYFDTLPRSPDKVAGRIYAGNFHGVILYETRQERFRLHALENASEALIVTILLLKVIEENWRVRETKSRRG
jgi:hypothetical protein